MKGKASKFWKCPREAEVEARSGQSSTEMVVVQSSLWMKTANQIRMTCLPRFMRRWQGLIQNLGYGEANHGDLVSKCVKFWYTNQLGSLTVFPFQPAVKAVHGVLAGSRFAVERNCKEYLRKLAYFLPITAKRGSLKKNEEKTFGYAKARAVFRGGGPFILEDSPDLAIRALTRLGYLDQFNTDVPEAMFLFLNSAENKGSLRKFGWLPGPGDNHVDVDRNLRVAFLWFDRGKMANQESSKIHQSCTANLGKKQNYSSRAFCQLLSWRNVSGHEIVCETAPATRHANSQRIGVEHSSQK